MCEDRDDRAGSADGDAAPPARQAVPLKGEVCEQYTRCGKKICRCREGHPHGPYYYRVWREGNRVKKAYVKPADLDLVRSCCDMYRAYDQALRGHRQNLSRLSRSISRSCRQARSLLSRRSKSRNSEISS